MSQTLGEKLRQAREERGISISEVAEQTRISPLYIESIENDDYSPLPGGIFNKGFIKSFAKFVGVSEEEALQDYAAQLALQNEGQVDMEPKSYRPQVLTDDRSRSSMLPTIIFAAIILGLMTWGVLTLVKYLQEQQNQPVEVTNTNTTANGVNSNAANSGNAVNAPTPLPAINEIKVELTPLANPISVESTIDGSKSNKLVTAEAPQTYTGQQSVRLRYYRGFADKVKITVNGKQITAPPAPAKGSVIEIDVNKENIAQFLQTGQTVAPAPLANTNANTR